MKKVLLIFVMLVVVAIKTDAQNYKNDGNPYYYYCRAAFTATGNYVTLTLSDDKQDQLRDENGKKIKFKDAIDLINYMSKRNWELIEITPQGFYLKKLVSKEDEAEDGLNIKPDSENDV